MTRFTSLTELFAGPEGERRWTKRFFCLANEAGEPFAWCLLGAASHVYKITPGALEALYKAIRARGFPGITPFNDDPRTTIHDIRAVCAEAEGVTQ